MNNIETLHSLALGFCTGGFIHKSFLYIEQGKVVDIILMVVLGFCIVFNVYHLNKKTE